MELQQRLLQATATAQSRMLAGELAAAVAHDFNNTLMVADVAIMDARDPLDPTTVPTRLKDAAEAIAKGRELALRLAGTARGERFLSIERRDLSVVTKSMLRALSKLPRLFGRKIELDVAPEAVAEVDVVLFEQMLANLVLNAADACGKRGVIRVRLSTDASHLCLEIHDNGPGIPLDKRGQIFQAFETGKPTGLGLGLFSVRAAVQAQGGTLDVGASPLGGAVFTARLPRRKRETEGKRSE
jgi:signal transduction histidine kinase